MSIFNKIAGDILSNKSAEDLLKGENSKYIDVGTHDVKIQAVDSSKVEEKNYIVVSYIDAEGKDIKEFVFIANKNKDGLGYSFRNLCSALFTCDEVGKSAEAVTLFLKSAANNNAASDVFTGMKLRIKVEMEKKGIQIRSTGDSKYVAVDLESSAVLTTPCETYKECRELLKEQGKYPIKRIVTERSATDGESNIKILNTALAPKSGTGSGSGNSGAPKFM
jgi:translation elongation factor P/translation initiation factor 5A